jgi:hypothetical protein
MLNKWQRWMRKAPVVTIESFAGPKSIYRRYLLALVLLLAVHVAFWLVRGAAGQALVALLAMAVP